MRKIDTIIVHCSAYPPNWRKDQTTQQKRDEIDRMHRDERGWEGGIGYHYVIDRDGTIAKGRPDEVQGAHVKGHNRTSLGVCLLGGFGSRANDKFSDHFTMSQSKALKQLLDDLSDYYPITSIKGHNAIPGANKACPGFKVKKWLNNQESAESVGELETTRPPAIQSTSIKGNLTNIVSGGGLASFGVFYQDLPDIERYIILGFGGLILLIGIWLFRKKLLKIADEHDL